MSQNKTVSQWLRTGKEMLAAAGRENPRMDAELLLEKVTGMNKIQRMTEGQTILDEKAAEEYAGKLDIYKVDVDQEPELESAFNIRTIPNLLLCPAGSGMPTMKLGTMNKMQLKELIETTLFSR